MRVFDAQAAHTFTYVNKPSSGRPLRRNEVKSGTTAPIVRYFYSMNGVNLGDVGTDKVKSRVDYRAGARRLR